MACKCISKHAGSWPSSSENYRLQVDISKLARSRPHSASPNLLDHSLQVHLQTRSITASKCISKLSLSCPPSASLSSLDLGLQVHLQTRSVTASNCISEFTRFRPPSASPHWPDHSIKVHVSTGSITAAKYIINVRRRVYGDTGVTEVDWATGSTYSGDPGVDRHHHIFISSGSTQLHGFSWPGSIISSHFLPRLLELEPPIMLNYHLWPDWPCIFI